MKKIQERIVQFDISPDASAGISAKFMQEEVSNHEHDIFIPHRDKHFLLSISTAGTVKMLVDFEEISVAPKQIILILPGQVHQVLDFDKPCGISINFDPSLVSDELRSALKQHFKRNLLSDPVSQVYQNLVKLGEILIETLAEKNQKFSAYSSHALLLAMLGLLAGDESAGNNEDKREDRSSVIYEEFQKLVSENYKHWKRPAEYASSLAISVSHLNDVVKKRSGESVSSHIQNRNILEAKRLLYFSAISVKEISFELGYDDPVYFSKLFKKATKFTPLVFRKQYRS